MNQQRDLPIGALIDGYVVERKRGAGGMGEIYEVREQGTGQVKALKILSAHPMSPQDERPNLAEERFQREAQVLAKLTALEHPNIISIHRYARFGDRQYIVMPLFNGIDLHEWFRTSPTLTRVVRVAVQLADAVAYAHEQGILHRDIKLSNALIGIDDRVKLIDFGMARDADEAHELTAVGTTSGTRPYLAPEYLSSHMDHDVLTEMWALGVLLYALITQRMPFSSPSGRNDDKIYHVIMTTNPIAIRDIRPDCSEELASIVSDLLQKDRSKRVKNARVLEQRLRDLRNIYQPGIEPGVPLPAAVPEKADTKPGRRQPSQPDPVRPPIPDNTSSEWSPRLQGIQVSEPSAPVIDEPSANGLLDDLFAGAPSPPEPPSLELSLQMPEVTNAFAPPASVVAPRYRVAPTQEPSVVVQPPVQVMAPAPPTQTPDAAPSVFGGAAPAAAPAVDAADPPPAETKSARGARPTFASANASPTVVGGGTGNPALRRLFAPALAAAAVAGGLVFAWQYSERAITAVKSNEYVDPEKLKQDRNSKNELAELLREKRDAPPPPTIEAPPAPLPALSPTPTIDAPPPTLIENERKPAGRKQGGSGGAVAAAAPAGPRSEWDDVYGGRDTFNTPSVGTKAPAAPEVGTATTAGVRIPVRLEGAVASSPSGPVIALVTKPTQFGAVMLPTGTQIHGQTSGTSGPRLLVSFSFAVVDGRQVPLKGIAMSADKRPGIPGARSIGGASDVAAGGAEGALRGIVDAAASVVGDNPGGAAIRGTAGAIGGKAARLNNEEEIVTTQRGANFVVYIGG